MMGSLLSDRTGRLASQQASGVIVAGVLRASVAASLLIVRHDGVTVSATRGSIRLAFAGHATAQWVGWHSGRVRSNGWQPYDQPHPAAYIPLSLEQCLVTGDGGDGIVMRELLVHKVGELIRSPEDLVVVCSEETLSQTIRGLFEEAGLRGFERELCALLETSARFSAA
jgi:hypothetical protein